MNTWDMVVTTRIVTREEVVAAIGEEAVRRAEAKDDEPMELVLILEQQ